MTAMEKTTTPKIQPPVAPAVRPELARALAAVTERHRELFRRLKDK